jgi:hypothetical protein
LTARRIIARFAAQKKRCIKNSDAFRSLRVSQHISTLSALNQYFLEKEVYL